MKNVKRKLISATVIFGLLVTVGWLATTMRMPSLTPSLSAGSTSDNYTPLVEHIDDQEGIHFFMTVDKETNLIDTFIGFNLEGKARIDAYTKFANRELAKSLQTVGPKEKVQVSITFKKAIDGKTFSEFVKKYGLDVQFYGMHGLEPSGRLVTIQGGPSETGELIPQEQLSMAQNHPDHPYKFLGWVDVTGYVESNKVIAINNDKLVYVVAAPELFFKSMLTTELFNKAGIKDKKKQQLFLKNGFSSTPDFGRISGSLFYENHPELKQK